MPRRSQSTASPPAPGPLDEAPGTAAEWVQRLLAWYRQHRRAMPWRDDPRPYPVWISEIMLQQTQVDTVIPYFARFLEAFPTVERLAAADQQEVLKRWEGLGYYSRARNLHACAKAVVADHGGVLPGDFTTLLTLPGFGPYTAAAVASIAFGQAVPVVDGNVLRVVTRFRGWADDITKPRTRDKVFTHLQPAIVASGDPSAFNQAVMELGALVCRPVAAPACASCPLQADCVAARDGLTASLPVKAARKAVPHHELAAAVIWQNGRVLLVQRPVDAMLGGLWMFPAGRSEGRTAAAVAHDEAQRQVGLHVQAGHVVAQVDHAYSHFTIRLTAVQCTVNADAGVAEDVTPFGGEVSAPSGAPVASQVWVALDDLDRLPLDKATLRVVAALRDLALFNPPARSRNG